MPFEKNDLKKRSMQKDQKTKNVVYNISNHDYNST
jgi:hypothetical protein